MDGSQSPNAELVKVAYAGDPAEAGLIQGLLENGGIPSILRDIGVNGPQLGYGILARSPQHVMVRADQAEDARVLLSETMPQDEQMISAEPVNARYLEEAERGGPRRYGLAGAYARIYIWSFGAMAVAFAVFLLVRTI